MISSIPSLAYISPVPIGILGQNFDSVVEDRRKWDDIGVGEGSGDSSTNQEEVNQANRRYLRNDSETSTPSYLRRESETSHPAI
jgi:hypothetical protein